MPHIAGAQLSKILLNVFRLILMFGIGAAAADTDHYSKMWISTKSVGPIGKDPNAKFYWDAHLNLIDTHYKFEQAYASVGLGYQTSPSLQFFLINSYVVSEKLNATIQQEYRLWQQINWVLTDNPRYSLMSRSRLEERKNFEAAPIAVRLREQLTLRIPIQNWPRHYYMVFDEVFFNLNHPSWVSPEFFQQNRAFIGISTDISKLISVDVGYLNQYVTGTTKQVNSVLYLNVNISPGAILHLN